MRILWLLPDLAYTSAARQALLLWPEFVRLGHQLEMAVLRSGGAMTPAFRSAELPVHELSTPHDVPFRAIAELEKLLRASPHDLIHAWRLPTMRAMATLRLTRTHRPKLLVSQLERGGRWNPLDRLLRQKADLVIPDLGEHHAVPLAVALPAGDVPPLEVMLPENARLVFVLGELTAEHGFRDAIWAFDVLKFVYPDIHLIVVGDGPERVQLEHFCRRLAGNDVRTHFVPGRADAALLLKHAAVVWAPSRKPAGEQVVLEAQLAGVPVVATHLSGLASLIVDQETGILVKPGDPVAMAMATRPLLDDPSRRSAIAAAAQSRLDDHRSELVALKWLHIYEETCRGQVA